MATRKTSPKPTRSSKTATKARSTKASTTKAKATASKAKKSTAAKKTTTKKRATKTEVCEESKEIATVDRRRKGRRKTETTAKKTTTKKTAKTATKASAKPAAKKEAAPQLERREKVNRRRQIDPTTCERDYSELEVEFMNALDEYKRTSGRMFPTCSEVLEVILGLGYAKLTPMELAARKALEPVEPQEGDDLEASVEAEANEALEESLELQSADEESLEFV